ncbi:uncharacterized protein ACR2FA_005322 [Aphomia sociella]
MCSWTSKYAILRDLCEAQGHVPSEINATVGTEPPPALEFTEETEEEYYRSYAGEGDYTVTAPNLGLIKEMLNMVNDTYHDSEVLGDGDAVHNVIQINQLNPNCAEFVPRSVWKNQDDSAKNASPKPIVIQDEERIRKPKRARNVAVASLLDALNKNETKDPLKLMKPDDFINNTVAASIDNIVSDSIDNTVADSIDNTVADSVQKVNGWLKSQNQNGTSTKMTPILTPGVMMFKRKNNTLKVATIEPQKSVSPKNKKYTPSVLATEYYKKYVEKAKLMESIKEDIWKKTERLMKEADAKKKEELANPHQDQELSQEETSKEIIKLDKLDIVRLPQHRHQLTGECIVCKTMCADISKRKSDLSVL